MAINNATYTGPSGGGAVSLSLTPQHATDVAFVVTSFELEVNPSNNLLLDITSVDAASGGNTVYNGSWAGGANNAYVNKVFVVAGLSGGSNNGTFICVASTATSVTLNNPSGTATGSTGTATCGWVSVGGTGGWLWMQQLNSLDPISWQATLGSLSVPWAALIVTVPTLGV